VESTRIPDAEGDHYSPSHNRKTSEIDKHIIDLVVRK